MRIPASLIIGDERFDEGFDVLEAMIASVTERTAAT